VIPYIAAWDGDLAFMAGSASECHVRSGFVSRLQAKVAYLGTLLGALFTSGMAMWLLVMVAGRCINSDLPHDSYCTLGHETKSYCWHQLIAGILHLVRDLFLM
jgi:hypothetical protein